MYNKQPQKMYGRQSNYSEAGLSEVLPNHWCPIGQWVQEERQTTHLQRSVTQSPQFTAYVCNVTQFYTSRVCESENPIFMWKPFWNVNLQRKRIPEPSVCLGSSPASHLTRCQALYSQFKFNPTLCVSYTTYYMPWYCGIVIVYNVCEKKWKWTVVDRCVMQMRVECFTWTLGVAYIPPASKQPPQDRFFRLFFLKVENVSIVKMSSKSSKLNITSVCFNPLVCTWIVRQRMFQNFLLLVREFFIWKQKKHFSPRTL